jgi:hypothetical protein
MGESWHGTGPDSLAGELVGSDRGEVPARAVVGDAYRLLPPASVSARSCTQRAQASASSAAAWPGAVHAPVKAARNRDREILSWMRGRRRALQAEHSHVLSPHVSSGEPAAPCSGFLLGK